MDLPKSGTIYVYDRLKDGRTIVLPVEETPDKLPVPNPQLPRFQKTPKNSPQGVQNIQPQRAHSNQLQSAHGSQLQKPQNRPIASPNPRLPFQDRGFKGMDKPKFTPPPGKPTYNNQVKTIKSDNNQKPESKNNPLPVSNSVPKKENPLPADDPRSKLETIAFTPVPEKKTWPSMPTGINRDYKQSAGNPFGQNRFPHKPNPYANPNFNQPQNINPAQVGNLQIPNYQPANSTANRSDINPAFTTNTDTTISQPSHSQPQTAISIDRTKPISSASGQKPPAKEVTSPHKQPVDIFSKSPTPATSVSVPASENPDLGYIPFDTDLPNNPDELETIQNINNPETTIRPKDVLKPNKTSHKGSWERKLGLALVTLSLGGLVGPLSQKARLETMLIASQIQQIMTEKINPVKPLPPSTPKIFNPLISANGEIIQPVNTDFAIIVPKIGINAPVVAKVNPGNKTEYDTVLKSAVAHASSSYLPDENGTVYLFSHSTNYDWFVDDLNAVFYLLKNLQPGDLIVVYYKNIRYTYKLTHTRIVKPTKISYLVPEEGKNNLILQTCWPPGSTTERLLLFADLIEEYSQQI